MATNRAKYRQRRILAAKTETTTGTAIALAAEDAALIVSNFSGITPDDPVNTRQLMGALGTERSEPGAKSGSCEFDVDVSGNGASGLPLWASTLLPACDMVLSGATFSADSGEATVTLGDYEDGICRKLYGARGNVTFTFAAGNICRARFRFTGIYTDDADVALLSPTLPTVQPPTCEGMTATIGGYTPRWSTIELDLGNQVELREDGSSNGALYAAGIPTRTPSLTIDPEVVSVATKDWRAILAAGTEAALSLVLGTVANNIMTFAATRCQVTRAVPGDRKGFSIHALTCQLNGATPFTLAFS